MTPLEIGLARSAYLARIDVKVIAAALHRKRDTIYRILKPVIRKQGPVPNAKVHPLKRPAPLRQRYCGQDDNESAL